MQAPSFDLGRIVATPGAYAVAELGFHVLIHRHASGDWGDIPPEDVGLNEAALEHGQRIFSVYDLGEDQTIWIITEADRSATTILTPAEY